MTNFFINVTQITIYDICTVMLVIMNRICCNNPKDSHLPFFTGPLRWLRLWQCRAGPFRQCRTKPNSKQLVKICYICPFKNKTLVDPDCCPLYRPVNTQLHPAGERQETTACNLHYEKEHKTYPRSVLENITKKPLLPHSLSW